MRDAPLVEAKLCESSDTISEERQLPFTHPRSHFLPLRAGAITSPKNRLLPRLCTRVCVRSHVHLYTHCMCTLVSGRRGGYRSAATVQYHRATGARVPGRSPMFRGWTKKKKNRGSEKNQRTSFRFPYVMRQRVRLPICGLMSSGTARRFHEATRYLRTATHFA